MPKSALGAATIKSSLPRTVFSNFPLISPLSALDGHDMRLLSCLNVWPLHSWSKFMQYFILLFDAYCAFNGSLAGGII